MRYAPVRQPRIADVLTERLESMIIEGSLKPGERLRASRAERRTALRAAALRMVRAGARATILGVHRGPVVC